VVSYRIGWWNYGVFPNINSERLYGHEKTQRVVGLYGESVGWVVGWVKYARWVATKHGFDTFFLATQHPTVRTSY
jgi:hypothetical protein